MPSIGEELANVRLDQMVESMGRGIANAQYQLDQTAIQLASFMSGMQPETRVKLGKNNYSLLELGFTPTFYQFVETVIEVKISISITSSTEKVDTTSSSTSSAEWGRGWCDTHASSVTGSYASKYQYSAEGSSLMRTKLVPVPPPHLLTERIRALMAEENKDGT